MQKPDFYTENFGGLRPEAWICAGSGFSREDLKSLVLSKTGFIGEAVASVPEICQRILKLPPTQLVLAPISRQEVLRLLLGNSRVLAQTPELRRLKRRRNFFQKLDRAVQAYRLSFAHAAELSVMKERVLSVFGEGYNPVRPEIEKIISAYEAYLGAKKAWDLPMLLQAARDELAESGWPKGIHLPERIYYFYSERLESLEQSFWEELSRHILVIHNPPFRGFPEFSEENLKPNLSWERWHTLDDAAERLAENLARSKNLSEELVLIPDQTEVRRALKRAFLSWGLPLEDPRDPTRLKTDELLKAALSPLEVVAQDFERHSVVSYLKNVLPSEEFPAVYLEINERGIRRGLSQYSGGKLNSAYERLHGLKQRLKGKLSCSDLGRIHRELLPEIIGNTKSEQSPWILPFFQTLWEGFVTDLKLLDQAEKVAPLLYWLERFKLRLAEAPDPVTKIKPARGVKVYRLNHARVPQVNQPLSRLWILGLPPDWLNGEGAGDYVWMESEREVLGREFQVRSREWISESREKSLKTWLMQAPETIILDAQYEMGGRERESLIPLFQILGQVDLQTPLDQGSHVRLAPSYRVASTLSETEIKLSPIPHLPGEKPEISATALDRYSRCGFQALAFNRWKIWDVKEPSADIWPEVRGNILHEAVRLLVESRDLVGHFSKSVEQVLAQALIKYPPKGLIRSPRIYAYAQARLLKILTRFAEKENEYWQKSQAKSMLLDDLMLRLEFKEFAVIGKPDRIDETTFGPFILDYKTSTQSPSGSDMLELGYRLQLPFYALAAQAKFKKLPSGVQFVELSQKGSRSAGVFFPESNGKSQGALTQVRSNSKSLLSDRSPSEVWAQFHGLIEEKGTKLSQGYFSALPTQIQECRGCLASDFCGLRRKFAETE